MSNITFDTTSVSEQLGIYDFFNVVLSGTIFVGGICIINQNLNSLLLGDISLQKGLGLILLCYVSGMILQEAGSKLDRGIFKIYKKAHRSILKGEIKENVKEKYKSKTTNEFIDNPLLLERYRRSAAKLLTEFAYEDEQPFENEYVNDYAFSVCQYYISVCGKNTKTEKLRALFAMSKTLIPCFFLLSSCAFLSIFMKVETSISIFGLLGISNLACKACADKVILCIVFAVIGGFFFSRAKRVMRNFVLIVLGTYDAIMRAAENNEIKDDTKELSLGKKEEIAQ